MSSNIFSVLDFGAAGNRKTVDTAAIQAAIDACSEASGGTVLFPPGIFLSGTISLKNNVNLHLSQNATLLGSPSLDHYPNLGRDCGDDAVALKEGGERIVVTNCIITTR